MVIRVGTSGWSYEDWVGPFYPVALRGKPDAWLTHYATRFRAVEIHSTFDVWPHADLVDAWRRAGVACAERGSGGFDFSLKLPREATHDALVAGDESRARAVAGRFDREVLDPLDGEGVLGAVLVQIPAKLSPTAPAVAGVQAILDALIERRVALELRGDWLAAGCVAPEAEALFANPDVCLVEPARAGRPPLLHPPRRARHAYLRLHGGDINPEAAAMDEARYDHAYTDAELAPWAARARSHEERHTDVRVIFNNRAKARAPRDALQLLDMLGRKPDVPLPRITEQTTLEV